RTDVKYLLSEEQLLCALAGLTGAYRVLEIEARRLHGYRTIYFDTPDLALYRQHHNGWRERYKVRERTYTDSDLTFLEIKHKIDATTTVKSRDSIAVRDGTVIVDAGADGLQSNNDEDPEKGYILIEGGTLDITAGLDGIQAEAKLAITGGEIAVSSGGGSANSSSGNWGNWGGPAANTSTGESAKGLKAGVDITIGGDAVIDIDSSDDALHSNDSLTIDGGALSLSSGDDGIHADATLTINGGVVSIAQSYEGIETAEDQELLTFAPSKAYQSIVFSSPELGNGANLVVYAGGRSTGTVTDGLYAGGTYTAGTQVTSLTITSIVTGGGATMGGFPGGPGGMRSPGGGRR
ncbi:MAG: carbohydrate-binding domain-containing protein, partial [Anaerolineae bacterium]